MAKKKERTPEEKAQHEAEVSFNRKYSGFKRSLKTLCFEEGLRAMELKLEYLLKHQKTPLPKEHFNYKQTVSCLTEAIKEYKQSLQA